MIFLIKRYFLKFTLWAILRRTRQRRCCHSDFQVRKKVVQEVFKTWNTLWRCVSWQPPSDCKLQPNRVGRKVCPCHGNTSSNFHSDVWYRVKFWAASNCSYTWREQHSFHRSLKIKNDIVFRVHTKFLDKSQLPILWSLNIFALCCFVIKREKRVVPESELFIQLFLSARWRKYE